jgi:tRNA-dihydrouridine synthase A
MFNKRLNHPISVAPMIDWTDRHCRYLLRLISRHVLLYTEMITTGALLHGDYRLYLSFDLKEKPLILQLGGSDPVALSKCAQLGEQFGYDGINLNVGCPSPRVKQGRFGACLMAEPEIVATCVSHIRASVNLPVTVKTRIGIDDYDSYAFLYQFIETVARAGCDTFIIHARKALLKGLTPKENREIPPLRYDVARQLLRDFPQLTIILNGGIQSLTQAAEFLQDFHGVMIGRAVMNTPYILKDVDAMFYGSFHPPLSQIDVMKNYCDYAATQLSHGVPLGILVRPALRLFQGMNGAKSWRRTLSTQAYLPGQNENFFENALKNSGFIKVC